MELPVDLPVDVAALREHLRRHGVVFARRSAARGSAPTSCAPVVDLERRNVLVHGYAEVDDGLVVDHLANLPSLRRFVASMTALL